MRILQIIDSLEAGGSERMAVSYANAMIDKIDFSGLVATRLEGPLKCKLNKKVSYLYLNKTRTFDTKALFRLRNYVITNKVSHIHAHSSSFFIAFLLKITLPRVRLIWHDHYGDSDFLDKRSKLELKFIIPFFDGIITVNQKLKAWAKENRLSDNVIFLPNFPSKQKEVVVPTILNGKKGARIICLANLRPQKNHFLLLDVASKLKKSHPEWTFHLVGKDFQDDYSMKIKEKIVELSLEDTVFVYDSRTDITSILDQSDIAILTSQSEGLPVALLEYGLFKMPVVVTSVGEISSVINKTNGFIVPSDNGNLFYDAITTLIESESLRKELGIALHNEVLQNFSEKNVIEKYLKWLQNQN
jgi:glycosyltransferase involved in cell wall biosynthesis